MGLRSVFRQLLSSSSSSESGLGWRSPTITEKEAPEKYVYMFYKFDKGSSLYSLYALNLDNPQAPQTIIEMDHETYPVGMGCVNLGSKVYFIGGQLKIEGKIFTSKKVYVLDLNNMGTTSSWLIEEGPKMHGGKANPVVIVAYGKIYVFGGTIRGEIRKTRRSVSYPHFGTDDMSAYKSPDPLCEVFDPESNEWTVLPCWDPFNLSNMLMGPISGSAVLGNKIYLCGPEYDIMSQFDVETQQWEHWYYDDATDYEQDDPLAYAIMVNGIIGRGILLDNTLFALGSQRNNAFCAYHLVSDIAMNNTSAYHLVSDIAMNNTNFTDVLGLGDRLHFRMESTGCSPFSGAEVVHLGGMKFCLIAAGSGPPIKMYTLWKEEEEEDDDEGGHEIDIRMTTFEVIQDKHGSGGIWWSANILDSCLLGADSGSILYCFTLN